MKQARHSLILLFFIGNTLIAQRLSHPVMASRDDSFSHPRVLLAAPDTIDVLAVMVQFQIDNDARTTGNGQFILTPPAQPVIDAPPHDRQYFVDHLEFVANYFRKSSKGKQIIRSTLLDSVFTLSQQMSFYSPPKTGPNTAVGILAREAWQKVDSASIVPDFSRYDCFVVFHAGAGRDIDLVSAIGFDPTPFDIPSLYIGLNAFREFFGPQFQGIPVSGGTFHITNSIIIPETESRRIPSTPTDIVLNLSINGLLCASIGNFLGLPDLFDTNTGRSGIGRFGLMDGQAIFSFAGLFPPEPSAWEKYWLGWIDPIVVAPGEHALTLPATGISDTVYKVPVSSREYFLVENRNRDPLSNGQVVTSTSDGQTRQQMFRRDTSGFNAFDVSAIAGVVTDVEDLDWSLPGGVDASGNFFDGGVLIWHIDETIIARNISANKVNANPDKRGVDLEEADGSQDIGREFGFLSPGAGSEEGTPLDFWFRGNPAPVFTNEFSARSHPNSDGNNLASSHITIRNFSPRGSRMSATFAVGDEDVSLLPGFPKVIGESFPSPSLTISSLNSTLNPAILVSTTGDSIPAFGVSGITPRLTAAPKLYAWTADGIRAVSGTNSTGYLATAGNTAMAFIGASAVFDIDRDQTSEIVIGQVPKVGSVSGGTVLGFEAADGDGDSLADPFLVRSVARRVTTSPVIADSMIAFGAEGGRVYFIRFDGSLIDSLRWIDDPGGSISGVSLYTGSNTFVITGSDGTVRITQRGTDGSVSQGTQRNFGKKITGPAVTALMGRGGRVAVAFATEDGYLYLVDEALNVMDGFPINTGGFISHPPALADVNGDSYRDIVVFSGTRLFAINFSGATLDYFPVTVGASVASAPIVADLDGDGLAEVVGVTVDGVVVAYDKSGRLAPGLPLQAGTGEQSAAVFEHDFGALGGKAIVLVVASSGDGSVSGWRTGFVRTPGPAHNRPWPQYQKDARHSGLDTDALSGAPVSDQFFPKERAYNWPNPVYDGLTFIRYFVRDNSTVTIKVFDLAGDLVTEIPNPPGLGGVDNEVQWDVSNIQSGIYFARIEASASNGSGVAVVKVAVVK